MSGTSYYGRSLLTHAAGAGELAGCAEIIANIISLRFAYRIPCGLMYRISHFSRDFATASHLPNDPAALY